MSHFRISLGKANCKNIKKDNTFCSKICELIQSKINAYSEMSYELIEKLSDEISAEYLISDKQVLLTIYKKNVAQDKTLIVVQAAYKTLRFPNYISLNFVGRVFVDGIILKKNGGFISPDEDLLFEFK